MADAAEVSVMAGTLPLMASPGFLGEGFPSRMRGSKRIRGGLSGKVSAVVNTQDG